MRPLFYLIDEHEDNIAFCKRKKLKPLIYKEIVVPDTDIDFLNVQKYYTPKYVYRVLQSSECYSGYPITLMREPQLSYEDLINVLLRTKKRDEKLGALGILLKQYPENFKQFFHSNKDEFLYDLLIFVREFNWYSFDVINDILGNTEGRFSCVDENR